MNKDVYHNLLNRLLQSHFDSDKTKASLHKSILSMGVSLQQANKVADTHSFSIP